MPNLNMKRGAILSPRHELAAAMPHAALPSPAVFLRKPAQLSIWGNDTYGDCVTAEEAFAKACNSPEIFISDQEVYQWANYHGFLNGAVLIDALRAMQTGGFQEGNALANDGAPSSVNWTDPATLESAIYAGPVKIGVAADQLETVIQNHGATNGWTAFGFNPDQNYDHCVSLCGYGPAGWLAQQLGAESVPSTEATACYAMFTWGCIGIIDAASLVAITGEAWVRTPTTIIVQKTFK